MSKLFVDAMQNSFDRAYFLLDGKVIEKSLYIKKNAEIIMGLLTDSKKERGIILHQGTNLHLYLAVILACFKSFIFDDTDKEAIIDELEIGDIVIYQNKRGKFHGIDSEGRIVIENYDRGTPTVNRIPRSLAYTISPYNGEGRTLDGRGVKNRTKINRFISKLFNIKATEIKSVQSKSVVVVCDKLVADDFMKRLSISVDDRGIMVGELFPSAYYTSNDTHYYSGNASKVEPLLKFTNKLSVARELIIDEEGIETLIINDTKYFNDDISELASVYNRNSLKSIILLGELYKGIYSSVFEGLDNLDSFVWTKESLEGIIEKKQQSNNICDESKRLQKMLNNFVEYEIKVNVTDHREYQSDFHECKKILYKFIRHNKSNEIINTFVTKGYWLLNLLERSFFPINIMEQLIIKGAFNALLPTRELESMHVIADQYINSSIKDDMLAILSKLESIKGELDCKNLKYEYLINLLQENKYGKKKMAVVCAKTYYEKVFLEAVPLSLKAYAEAIDFFTPNKFSSTILYDEVIVIGVYDWDKLNPILLSNSKILLFLLYPNERKRLVEADAFTKKRLFSIGSGQSDTLENIDLTATTSTLSEPDETIINEELDSFTRQLSNTFAISELSESAIEGMLQQSEIKRVAILETGEKVFFTKNYTSYTYDVARQVVVESDVTSLEPGDLLIFTSYDNDTKDIVQKIMDMVLQSEKCDEHFKESYKKSIQWKKVLKEYKEQNGFSFKELSKRLGKIGKGKHEVTIKTWFDDDSHIVGPRDSGSYHQIAKLTKNVEMMSDPDSFYHSCREVRSMRIRILKYIGKNIIQTYNKTMEMPDDEILSKLPIDLSKMSRLIQIEKLFDVDNYVIPSHLTNRPQNI
jgi:hypothetical protein